MIRRDILIDTVIDETKYKKNNKPDKKTKKPDTNRRISPPNLFAKSNINLFIVKLELLGVILGIITMLVLTILQTKSWWFLIGCVILFMAALWAIGLLPNRVKDILKVTYYRIQTIGFMIVTASIGYTYTKLVGIIDYPGIIFFTSLSSFISLLIHVPLLKELK